MDNYWDDKTRLRQSEMTEEQRKQQDLYFEVFGIISGFRQLPKNAIFYVNQLGIQNSPYGPIFGVDLAIGGEPEIDSPPNHLLWERLVAHCRKTWLVATADDSKLKSALAKEHRQVIGAFRSAGGIVFWLCRPIEKDGANNFLPN